MLAVFDRLALMPSLMGQAGKWLLRNGVSLLEHAETDPNVFLYGSKSPLCQP
jgi:hypothetical protein